MSERPLTEEEKEVGQLLGGELSWMQLELKKSRALPAGVVKNDVIYQLESEIKQLEEINLYIKLDLTYTTDWEFVINLIEKRCQLNDNRLKQTRALSSNVKLYGTVDELREEGERLIRLKEYAEKRKDSTMTLAESLHE